MRAKGWVGQWIFGPLVFLFFSSAPAWGYFFDDRQEIGLSGFFYSRAVLSTQDSRTASAATQFNSWNLVSHRNFGTLELRHNLNRGIKEFPTLGPVFRFLDLGAFDYYLDFRAEYDGVFDYGPNKIRRMQGGTRRHAPYFDDRNTEVPFDGLYYTPGASPDFPAETVSLSNRRWLRGLRDPKFRLFEWYFNITKGPLFVRIGRQNLSWGETDAFRLLDQINPLDGTFGGFLTSLDERRIPLKMLRAQWGFGTVGPIQDLTLEGFWSISDKVPPALPTSSSYFWGSPQNGNTPIMVGRTPCGGHLMEQKGLPPYFEDPDFPYFGSGQGARQGGRPGCSGRANMPRSNLEDGRGGFRILGTIADFTWSIAHYYTYQDLTYVRAKIISPTRDHMRWDLGLPTDSQGRAWNDNIVETPFGTANTANPWGADDPVALRAISSGANEFGRGGVGSMAGAERNIRSTPEFERIQVTGGSLSFPINALTSLFVGPDNPLYYSYTTLRSEVAWFRRVPTMRAYAHGDSTTAFDRFLGGALGTNAHPITGVPAFGPEGALANQAGARAVRVTKRDYFAWNIGLDHNQWIRWLNHNNTFFMSAQLFWLNRNGQDTTFDHGSGAPPPSVFNDKDVIAGRKRARQQPVTDAAAASVCAKGTGSRAGCSLWNFAGREELLTFIVNTQYLGGNLRPRIAFFYAWSGSWLIQPGLDWIFWDPFRLSLRYSWIEGRGNSGIGILNRKDNVWFELQYLLY